MSTLTTILGTALPSNSRADINSNFSALNTDKIETSVLDTDTALTANSDAKVATQKAVKAYVDGVGTATATTTVKGTVEIATQAQVTAGTALGETGASIVVTPATLMGLTAPVIRKYVAADSPATWTKPTGLKYVIVECQGAGGDGGSTDNGGGGGGGGYTKKVIAVASLGATETVTIGAGGVGTGDTSFGALLTAGNGGDASGRTGGASGGATTGDLNIPGQAGYTVTNNTFAGGNGGSSVLGMGGQGGLYPSSGTGALDGAAGAGFGGGGGGAGESNDGTPDGNAGAGTGGIVIVTEYYV